MSNITLNEMTVRVDGKVVATLTSPEAFALLRDALLDNLTRTEAVYVALSLLGTARTAEVADFLNEDRSNIGRRLEELADEKRIVLITDDDRLPGGRGRPSRLWAVK